MANEPGPLVEREGSLPLSEEADLPPVVARMVVEIRSDGRRTIARGALEDKLRGETVQLRVDGGTPLALAKELMQSLLRTPVFAQKALSRLLTSRSRRP